MGIEKRALPVFQTHSAAMAEFFAKGPASNFTKMSKQFAQEQVMQQAIQDYAQELQDEENAKLEKLREMEITAKKEESDDEFDFSDDDEISNRIMEERMAQMRGEALEAQSWNQKGHGKLSEITEEDFLKTVTKSHLAVVHFYHREFSRCKIVDMHLEKLANKYIATKFVKLDAEKAPFFVNKLMVVVMPCVCMFEDGKMVGRIDGFDILGGEDDFPTEVMECVIGASGVIAFKPPEDQFSSSIFDKCRMDIVGLNANTRDSDSDDD